MKNLLYIVGAFILLGLMNFAKMDFFSSMTKADYDAGSKSLKFTAKINVEHIANTVKINPNSAGFEAGVKKYVGNNFAVEINGSIKSITFTGSQISDEAVWIYFEVNNVESISTMKIKNTILFDAYPKQFNVVNIVYKGQQKTMNFQKGKEINEVSF